MCTYIYIHTYIYNIHISYKCVQYVCVCTYRIYVNAAYGSEVPGTVPRKSNYTISRKSPGWHRKVGPVDASECPTIPARHSPSQGISSGVERLVMVFLWRQK